MNNKLYIKNKELIDSVIDILVKRYQIDGYEPEDLRQECLLYLHKYLKNYVPKKGLLFSYLFNIINKRLYVLNLNSKRVKRYSKNTISLNYINSTNKELINIIPAKEEEEIEKLIIPKIKLSKYEQYILTKIKNGTYNWKNKKQENTRTRIIYKLRKKMVRDYKDTLTIFKSF